MRERAAKLLALATGLAIVLGAVLFGAMQQRAMHQLGASIDPARWAELFPRHYESFMRTAESYGRTEFGGSEPYDKLAANPFRRRAFAGHPFALEYNAARGHYYAQIDQRASRRTREVDQPAACIHCHAAEAPALLAEDGAGAVHRLRYAELAERLHFGSSCADCHQPATMALTVTRPAFIEAMRAAGVDLAAASRAELRTYVCAQCHLEYYTAGPDQVLRLPWSRGRSADDIEQHYDDLQFSDFVHAETGAPLIKIQHPEFELAASGLHAALGVSCADCHMPTVQEAGLRIGDHWIRSPLTDLATACGSCHRGPTEGLRGRVVAIQRRTTELLGAAEADRKSVV